MPTPIERTVPDTPPSAAIRSSQWTPLLTGNEARHCRRVIDEIAAALRDPAALRGDPSLASGLAGTALFFAELYRVSGAEPDLESAAAHLNAALDLAGSTDLRAGLFSGLYGLAFAATIITRDFPVPSDEDPVAMVDEMLEKHLAVERWDGDYDLVGGLVGLGVYCLVRLPAPRASDNLGRVVDHLSKLAIRRENGIAWPTPPGRLPDYQRRLAPQGYCNLGVAHGVPGAVALLAQAARAGVRSSIASRLADGAVSWMLAQRLPSGSRSLFPCWVPLGDGELSDARTAWCYGDLGISATLLTAAAALERPDWESEALAIARHAGNVPPAATGIQDAGICHGAIGAAHLYNRIHQASAAPVFAASARRCLDDGLARQRPGEAFAGFPAFAPTQDAREHPWRAAPGLLDGAAGVGLGLIAAIGDHEPAWDRLLLTGPAR